MKKFNIKLKVDELKELTESFNRKRADLDYETYLLELQQILLPANHIVEYLTVNGLVGDSVLDGSLKILHDCVKECLNWSDNIKKSNLHYLNVIGKLYQALGSYHTWKAKKMVLGKIDK